MDATETDGSLRKEFSSSQQQNDEVFGEDHALSANPLHGHTTKRKHRRGKPKSKNGNKPYKKTNWKFQVPRYNYQNATNFGNNNRNRSRIKLERSRSIVPYNTNKFLMEEHLAEVPSSLLTPSARTRDSSFSVDSEDNYFYSLPEDEEEFLTKEFANVYETARMERLENLTKEQLIEECLQIEDRYSTDQGTQQQQRLNVQRISAEFMAKIRLLEEKIKELSRENYNLRCQLMRSAALAAAAAASPPSATAPTGGACEPVPMESTSEDSESDSSSSSSSVSHSSRSDNDRAELERDLSVSPRSSASIYDDFVDFAEDNDINNESNEPLLEEAHMDDNIAEVSSFNDNSALVKKTESSSMGNTASESQDEKMRTPSSA